MLKGISQEALLEALESMRPVELQAVQLLRLHRKTGEAPKDHLALTTATEQLIEYTDRCGKVASVLRDLSPVVVTDTNLVEEYPL